MSNRERTERSRRIGGCLAAALVLALAVPSGADALTKDVFETSAGDLEIVFIGHGTLMMTFGGKTIHIDPVGRVGDYSTLPRAGTIEARDVSQPRADLVLITHHHGDHMDAALLKDIRTEKTVVVCTARCAETIDDATVMKNGDVETFLGIGIEAVPAYNIVHKRDNGDVFHPKGEGNGYVLTFGKTKVYIAGDTENVPEMKTLENIDIAFLPMNLPYTMTPEMVADAAVAFGPRVLYPYHYGETDTAELTALLADHDDIEVRIRNMP